MSPTITVGSFFRRVRSTFLFICSTTSNLNNVKPQQRPTSTTPISEARPKRKEKTKLVQKLENTLRILPWPHFFSALCDFFSFFGLHQMVPLHFFRYFATQWMSKNRKGSPFYIFRHCDTVQKSHKKFFLEIFSCPQRVPSSIFFPVFATSWSFTKPEGSPFSNFEP